MIFISLSVYALAKELGADDAVAEVHRQLAELAATGPAIMNGRAAVQGEYLPAVKCIARLRLIDEVELRVDAGATCIGKARSRAFHAFRKSAASTWVSVDDDVDATRQTLEWLVEAVARGRPRICLAPCLLRGPRQEPTLNVELPQVVLHRPLSNGGLVRNCNGGGFGLVALNRAAVDAIVSSALQCSPKFNDGIGDLDWLDDDKEIKLAVFHDELAQGKWWGEDRSFFRRVPKSVDIECLASGIVAHDGAVLDLGKVRELGAPF